MRHIRWAVTILLLLAVRSPCATAPWVEDGELGPSPQHRRISRLITEYLKDYHYKEVSLDDALSAQVLRHYIEALDPNRSYFTQEELRAFERYRDHLDEALNQADLDPAYAIFKVFRSRLKERVAYAQALLARSFDFSVDEDYVVDRGALDWARDRAELDELWRKKVKNDVLSLRVAGQTEAEVLKTLKERYEGLVRHTYQLSADDVFEIFINAFTLSIEPHTTYFSPRNSKDFRIRMSLSLDGIGAVLRNENELTIVQEVVAGGPAEKGGQLHPEDRIVAVAQGTNGDWVEVIGWRLEKVVDLIRGRRGTVVRLRVLPKGSPPGGQTADLTLTRDTIKLEDQAAKKSVIELPPGRPQLRIGVIQLPAFYIDFAARARGDRDYRSTTRDVRRLIGELTRADVDGIIMDLRGNGGGSLIEATELTGLFIPEGPIVQVRDKSGTIDINEDTDPAVIYQGPLLVLVDGQSASASEIFAAAIQDYRRGIVVGEPTFGKGTVQNLFDLDRSDDEATDLGQLKATVAQFFRVNGSSTQHRGVQPDIAFPTELQSDDQGERSLDNALPWDAIRPVRFVPLSAPLAALQQVRWRHQYRVSHSPVFNLLKEELARQRQEQKRNRLSLAEVTRRNERQAAESRQGELERRLRDALQGTAYDETDPKEKTEEESLAVGYGRVVLYEAAQVLRDVIETERRTRAVRQAGR